MIEPLAPLVVYLHGPSGRPSDFGSVSGRLPERFPSLAPPVSWDATSPRERAARLVDRLRGEGRPLVLVAGAHAACMALEIARRDGARVRGLVLSGCSDDPREGFGRAGAPVLLLWGTEDTVTPPAVGRRLRDALPGARLLFIQGAGHEPVIERPSVFAFHLTSFLNDLAPELRPARRLLDEAA